MDISFKCNDQRFNYRVCAMIMICRKNSLNHSSRKDIAETVTYI